MFFHSYEEIKEGKGKKVKHEKTPKLPLLDIYQKELTHPLSGAWSLLLDHVQFTPNQVLKDL
jgi:hypothetical protein